MSTCRMWQPWHASNEQGEYCSKRFSSNDRLKPLYKLSPLLYLLCMFMFVCVDYVDRMESFSKEISTIHVSCHECAVNWLQ